MIHKKEDFIMFIKDTKLPFDSKVHKCICADKEFAVFAPVSKKRDGGYKTHLSKLWCCGQNIDTTISDWKRVRRGAWSWMYPTIIKN